MPNNSEINVQHQDRGRADAEDHPPQPAEPTALPSAGVADSAHDSAHPATKRPDGMPRGRKFLKGASGNPRGRPKSLKEAVLERLGGSGERLVHELFRIATDARLRGHAGARVRLLAWCELRDMAWGKPTASMVLDGREGLRELVFGGRFANSGVLEPGSVTSPVTPAIDTRANHAPLGAQPASTPATLQPDDDPNDAPDSHTPTPPTEEPRWLPDGTWSGWNTSSAPARTRTTRAPVLIQANPKGGAA